MDLYAPQLNSNGIPLLLVIIPGQYLIKVPVLFISNFEPLEIFSIN